MKKLSLLLFVLLGFAAAGLAQKTVKGSVKDSRGEPLIGANVIVQGSDVGTVTDIDGMFSIVVPPGLKKLVVSYIGFNEQELDVTDQIQLMLH